MPNETLFNLKTTFGLVPEQAQTKIKDLPSLGAWPAIANGIGNAKLRYPDAYGYLKYKGWTDEQFLNLSAASAAAEQAVMYGQFEQWGADIRSRVSVDIPEGEYFMNYPFPKAMGQYVGVGPHLGWNPRQAATTLRVWKDQWLGPAGEDMYAMRSANWGATDTVDAWMHASLVDKIGFVGNNGYNWKQAGWTEHGLGLWDEGEASSVHRIWTADHNGYGVQCVRGTPFTADSVISTFTNVLGGVGLIGTQMSTIRIGTISGDDNAAMIVQADGFGRKAGGSINVGLVKVEGGKRPVNHGQIVVWQRDPVVGVMSIGTVQMDQNGQYNDAAFVMKSREWGQVLHVAVFNGWNFATLVHDVTNKKRFASNSYRPESFVYCSRDGGTVSDLVTLTHMASSPAEGTDRYGTASSPSGFNYANGTPTYSVTGTVAPPAYPGTWQTGAWGPCTNGKESRLVTCTGGTCDPALKPAEIRDCVTTPPPTGTITAFASHTGTETGIVRDAAYMVDNNPSSFWISGRSMTAGTMNASGTVGGSTQYIEFDYGAVVTRGSIAFDAPNAYVRSFPGLFDVWTTVDDVTWTKVRADVTGAYPTCTATFTPVALKKLRVVCKKANSDWWGVSAVR